MSAQAPGGAESRGIGGAGGGGPHGSGALSEPPAFDPEEHRRSSLQQWEDAASGWAARQEQMRRFSQPVSEWLLNALQLQPGQSVLDLAAGVGETGCLAAQRVSPGGTVIIGDQAEAMGAAAKARAQQLGLDNVAIKQLNAESIDLEVGSLDAVLCRWGFMLMADPDAALKECRRVLKPGGRLALAVWGQAQRNPWAVLPALVLIERGILPPPGRPGGAAADRGSEPALPAHLPGMFALAEKDALAARLESAGFGEVQTAEVALTREHSDFEDFWETTLDMSSIVHDAVMERPFAEIKEIRSEVEQRLAPFAGRDGSLRIPAVTLVASASA